MTAMKKQNSSRSAFLANRKVRNLPQFLSINEQQRATGVPDIFIHIGIMKNARRIKQKGWSRRSSGHNE